MNSFGYHICLLQLMGYDKKPLVWSIILSRRDQRSEKTANQINISTDYKSVYILLSTFYFLFLCFNLASQYAKGFIYVLIVYST